ncbi:MAG: helix-turn-helix domain-containing protein [Candidatus Bathyarchaeia archaeon]
MYEKILEMLKEIGLTELEASIYESLLNKPKGESLDSILSSYNVQQDLIEDAIWNLVNKGLVSVVSNRLEVFPPKKSLAKILEEKRKELEKELEDFKKSISKLKQILEPIYWEKRFGIKPEDILDPMDGLSDMEAKTIELIKNAEKEILIFAATFGWYEKVREELTEALSKKVKVKVLMIAKDEASIKRAYELKKNGIEVRYGLDEWYPLRGTLRDEEELVFLIWATRKDVSQPIHYKPHYTRNKGLIKVFIDAFYKKWSEAKAIT